MTSQQEDRVIFLGRVLFMVLFLFVLSVKFDKPERQTYFAAQYELITEIHSGSNNALCVDSVQLPSLQKSLVSFTDKTGFSLFNESFKLSFDNSRITQRIILLQKSAPSRAAVSSCRFYYHLFSTDAQEPPLLS